MFGTINTSIVDGPIDASSQRGEDNGSDIFTHDRIIRDIIENRILIHTIQPKKYVTIVGFVVVYHWQIFFYILQGDFGH